MRRAVATQVKKGWRAAALLALLLCACGKAQAPDKPASLRLGMDLWAGYFPAVIAKQEGLMAAEGVALDVTLAKDTRSLIARFAAGDFDLIGVSLGDAITLSQARPDLVVLVVSNESAGGDQVLRGRDAPAIDRSGQRPLRVATSFGGFGELFLQTWMGAAGIDPQQVAWANVDASDIPAALAEGRIDYGHTWQPYAAEAVAAGAVPVFTSAETPGLILDVVLATRAGLARQPEAYQAFLRAWFEAQHRWRADPEAGNAAVAAALGLDPATISLQGVKLYSVEDNRQAMAGGKDSPLASLVTRYADFFIERGSLSAPPDATTMIDASLLPGPATAP